MGPRGDGNFRTQKKTRQGFVSPNCRFAARASALLRAGEPIPFSVPSFPLNLLLGGKNGGPLAASGYYFLEGQTARFGVRVQHRVPHHSMCLP